MDYDNLGHYDYNGTDVSPLAENETYHNYGYFASEEFSEAYGYNQTEWYNET